MKKKIALVTGGYSGESVISYKSAESMRKNLDTDKWDYQVIDINPASDSAATSSSHSDQIIGGRGPPRERQ